MQHRMSITLSFSDLERLRRAIEVLVSPLAHADVDAWRSAVTQELRELLGADSGTSLTTRCRGKSAPYQDDA